MAKMARRPDGLLGPLACRMMNSNKRKMIHWTLEQLDPQPDERLLEIGFGWVFNPGLGARL